MSKYTTELRYICENQAGYSESQGYDKVNEILELAYPNIFNFDFPIFDESYRKGLCIKILKHYYTREIGLETYGLWKLKLDTKLNEIMPYYNQLYESALLQLDPLHNYQHTKTYGRDSSLTQSSNANNSESGNSDRLYSDTPQSGLTQLKQGKYLTNATANETSITRSGTTTNNGSMNESYVENVVGLSGIKSQSKLLEEYRQTFLNIDMQVIDALNDLFFGLWE